MDLVFDMHPFALSPPMTSVQNSQNRKKDIPAQRAEGNVNKLYSRVALALGRIIRINQIHSPSSSWTLGYVYKLSTAPLAWQRFLFSPPLLVVVAVAVDVSRPSEQREHQLQPR